MRASVKTVIGCIWNGMASVQLSGKRPWLYSE